MGLAHYRASCGQHSRMEAGSSMAVTHGDLPTPLHSIHKRSRSSRHPEYFATTKFAKAKLHWDFRSSKAKNVLPEQLESEFTAISAWHGRLGLEVNSNCNPMQVHAHAVIIPKVRKTSLATTFIIIMHILSQKLSRTIN